MTGRYARLVRSGRELIVGYGTKFIVVGTLGYVIDLVLFNGLRLGTETHEPLLDSSFSAKAISVTVATFATWVGNRYWTFRSRRRPERFRELLEFSLVAVGGMGISLGCLWVSREVLDFTSLFADNIAANVVGLGLATAFRFLLYRYWVYGDGRATSST